MDLESGDIGRALKVQSLYGDRRRQAGRLRFIREPLRLPDESAEMVAYAAGEGFDLGIFDTARRVFAVKDEHVSLEVFGAGTMGQRPRGRWRETDIKGVGITKGVGPFFAPPQRGFK